MIDKFKAEGFKSLVMEEPVEFGRFNVLIGANGAGKSNVLEAIGVLGAGASGQVEPESLTYRGVRPGVSALYKTSLKGQRIRRIITLQAWGQGEGTFYRIGLDNPIGSQKARWRISSETLSDGSRKVLTRSPRGCVVHGAGATARSSLTVAGDQTAARMATAFAPSSNATALLEELAGFAIYAPTTMVLRGLAADVHRDPLGLSGGGLPEAVKDVMNRADGSFGPFDLDDIWDLIEWAQDVAAVPVVQVPQSPAVKTTATVLRFTDRSMRPGRNVLSDYDASEGALYVLFLLALVSHPRAPSVVAVDNFDHALHPRLAAALTRLVGGQVAAEQRRQVFLTTHNPLVLDGLDLGNDLIRLFAVERDPTTGGTRVNRVTVTKELMAEAERGLSLSRLWVMGRLGAVPRAL